MPTFPPLPASLSGNTLTIDRYLAEPEFVARKLQTLVDLRYVGTDVLTGRVETSGGAAGWESVTGVFADRTPKAVAPGAEYPLTTVGLGTPNLVKVTKWGEDTIITDEDIERRKIDAVNRGMLFLANSVGQLIDQAVMAAVYAAITNTAAAAQKWDGSGTTPFILRDIMKAKASIRSLNLGYNPNALLIDDLAWANTATDPVVQAAMAREDRSNPIYSGKFDVIAGCEVIPVPTANLPGGVGTNAFVVDRNRLGFIAYERLAGGNYASAGDLIEAKSWRPEDIDGWRVRARANFAPAVTDPGAGFRISTIA
jgi:hypothetical protein